MTALKVRGEDAWEVDRMCILCKRSIAADEEVYIVGAHVMHAQCLEWLLSQPDWKFERILRELPGDTHGELRRLREERRGGGGGGAGGQAQGGAQGA